MSSVEILMLTHSLGWHQRSNGRKIPKWLQPLSPKHWWTYIQTPQYSLLLCSWCICDPSLALQLDWLTHNDLCGSDHFPVILKTCHKDDEPVTGNSTRQTGCPSTLSVCHGCLMSLALSEDPVAQFTNTLIDIANQIIPNSHTSKNKLTKVPRFTNVCKQALM